MPSGGGLKAPSGALPIGQASVADPLMLTKISAGSELMQCLLALSHAPAEDQVSNISLVTLP